MLYPYTLGIVVIMKNEAPYVKEWLDYHLNAGVDVIFLYDNDSEDNLEEIIAPYIERGEVIYHKFPGKLPQLRCYHEALLKYRYECKYLAFIDADEFIYPTGNGSIKEWTENFFEGRKNLAYLYIYWHYFGSNGQEKADLTKGVLERFNKRGLKTSQFGKAIMNPRLAADFRSTPHGAFIYDDLCVLDELGKNPLKLEVYSDKNIFIAHYATKSKEEFFKKKSGANAFYTKSPYQNDDGSVLEESFKKLDKNSVEDNRVYEYYLKNLKAPIKGNARINCIDSAIEILTRNDLNMEEYLSAAHILANENFFSRNDTKNAVKELFQMAFSNAQKNITVFYAQMFLEDFPFIFKCDIFEKNKLKAIAEQYIDELELVTLSKQSFNYHDRLTIFRKWLDIV